MKAEVKSLDKPDQVMTMGRSRDEIVHIADGTFTRSTLEPGWRWSEDEKPIVGGESCQVPHCLYVVSGRVTLRSDDGTELNAGAGEVFSVPAGHDAWTVGNEPCVLVEFAPGG